MESYNKYIKSVEEIRPSLVKYVHIIISAVATLIFKSRQVCITIWLVGPSSSGKGEILKLTSQLPSEEKEFEKTIFHRSDKFTENSFVSNRADVREESAREKLDLLRKLPDKVLVTAELGSFVTGQKDKLLEKFGILTRVLDGEGLFTDTGAHGHRAVDHRVEFVWIGGVTELTPNKHEALSQIGGRVMTLDLECEVPNIEQLMDEVRRGFPIDKSSSVAKTLAAFYKDLFNKYPRGTVVSDSVEVPKEILSDLVKLSILGALLRSNVSLVKEGEGEHSARASKEMPFRYLRNLHHLARSSAVLRGNSSVDYWDLCNVILPIVLSSGPETRHKIFSHLIVINEEVSIKTLMEAAGFGRTAIYSALRELKALGLLQDPDSITVGEDSSRRFQATKEYGDVIRCVKERAGPLSFSHPQFSGRTYFLPSAKSGVRAILKTGR